MGNSDVGNLAGDFNINKAESMRCLRGPAPAWKSEGNAKEPRMPALGLGSEGQAVAARREAKRRSRSGGGWGGDGSPDFPNHCSSDHRFSSGDGGGDFASGSLSLSAPGSVTDGGDFNDLVSICNPFPVISPVLKSIFFSGHSFSLLFRQGMWWGLEG